MMKLFVIDLLVKCVVLIISALIWFGPAHAAAQDATLAVAPPPRARPTIDPAARAALMTGAGVLAAAAGGGTGLVVGGMAGLTVNGFYGIMDGANVGVALGASTGASLGVFAAGHLMDGNGKWWGLLLGQAVTTAPLVALYFAEVHSSFGVPMLNDPGFVAAALLLPALGASIGYELTSDRSAYDAKYGTVVIQPTVSPTKDGMALGLNVAF